MHGRIFVVSRNKNDECLFDDDILADLMPIADWVSESDDIIETDLNWLKHDYGDIEVGDKCFNLSLGSITKLRTELASERKKAINDLLADDDATINWWRIADIAWPETELSICIESDGPMHFEQFLMECAQPGTYHVLKVFDYHY